MLTRTESSALRGLAIIGIFLHNYCHWLGFAVKENEYTFIISKSSQLIQAIMSPDWNLPIHLLSFFGHYGVPVFLFLSAYGLVMKYENRGGRKPSAKQTAFLPFVSHHYVKLFKMMIVGFVIFTMVDAITPGRHNYQVMDILGQLLMFNNMMPDPDHVIWPGPYWFFGLMMQLYIVYRLLLWRKGDIFPLLLIVICWAMQAFCDPEGDTLNRVRYNFMGGVLPFCAGLLYARRGKQMSHAFWVTQTIVSIVLVFFFSFNFQMWL
ncbi:acyltransferase family protein, partial [uncultured Prevotella sp.]